MAAGQGPAGLHPDGEEGEEEVFSFAGLGIDYETLLGPGHTGLHPDARWSELAGLDGASDVARAELPFSIAYTHAVYPVGLVAGYFPDLTFHLASDWFYAPIEVEAAWQGGHCVFHRDYGKDYIQGVHGVTWPAGERWDPLPRDLVPPRGGLGPRPDGRRDAWDASRRQHEWVELHPKGWGRLENQLTGGYRYVAPDPGADWPDPV